MKFVTIKQCKFENASREKRKLIILIKMDMSKNETGFFFLNCMKTKKLNISIPVTRDNIRTFHMFTISYENYIFSTSFEFCN